MNQLSSRGDAEFGGHQNHSHYHNGLSGQPLSGHDIGGFAGNATPKLFGRWLAIGAMFPFSRGHSEKGTVDHEPWYFGEECEEVCRLALRRRYCLIPHIYTLFYLAHTKGYPVASPAFFADSKDSQLRTNECSFLLGPLLVYASTTSDLGVHQVKRALPDGIWMSFDFEDSHPDLPGLYLKGGSIIPFGPACQHVGEANPDDDLSLFVALDENGKAEGVLFEDDGDGYGYINGDYLLTTYVAELNSSVITVSVSKTEGSWKRPNRRLHVLTLLGEGALVDAWGTDGEDLQIAMPSENEVSKLILLARTITRSGWKLQSVFLMWRRHLDIKGLSFQELLWILKVVNGLSKWSLGLAVGSFQWSTFPLDHEELFETVSQALVSSIDRDCLSGWGGHVYIVHPLIHCHRAYCL